MPYWVTGSIAPFDDSQRTPSKPVITEDPHIDTTEFDQYRQGVELKTVHQLYGSNQPKMFGGSIDPFGRVTHEQNIDTLGQATSFTSFFNSSLQEDLPIFNAVDYILMGADYPLPIWTNNGPQQEQEAIMEPLPTPYRLPSIDGSNPTRGVHGSIDFDNLQIILDPSTDVFSRPFLDQGRDLFGLTSSGAIVLPGYVSSEGLQNLPYVEERVNDKFIDSLPSINATFKQALKNMTGSIDGTVSRTDSIAYSGWLR